MTDTEVAYIAGLMDGEAYIGIKKSPAYACQGRITPGYHARIQVRMVDEDAIRFVAESLGGWYYREKASSAKGRPLYCYQASDAKAAAILARLLPFLRVKRAVAELVLSLRALQAEGHKHRTKVTGYRKMPGFFGPERTMPNRAFSDEYVQRCDELYLACKEANRVGV